MPGNLLASVSYRCTYKQQCFRKLITSVIGQTVWTDISIAPTHTHIVEMCLFMKQCTQLCITVGQVRILIRTNSGPLNPNIACRVYI